MQEVVPEPTEQRPDRDLVAAEEQDAINAAIRLHES